jgi:hypothetical protein
LHSPTISFVLSYLIVLTPVLCLCANAAHNFWNISKQFWKLSFCTCPSLIEHLLNERSILFRDHSCRERRLSNSFQKMSAEAFTHIHMIIIILSVLFQLYCGHPTWMVNHLKVILSSNKKFIYQVKFKKYFQSWFLITLTMAESNNNFGLGRVKDEK